MLRGQTHLDRRYGKPPGTDALIALWNDALVDKLLGLVWNAYDELCRDGWSKEDWTQQFDDLERSLSEEMEQAIQKAMDGYLPVYLQHGPFEREARQNPPTQPPQYDLAFKWTSDPRIMWPLEAKVLKSDKNTLSNLGDYVETVQMRFLTGYYAPFSNGGAMLGYLKSGSPETVTANIAIWLECELMSHPNFPNRCHNTSEHTRTVAPGKDYPLAFRCHHLIMPLGGETQPEGPTAKHPDASPL